VLNNSVLSFYDNFGLIFKGSEDKATNGIEHWWLSTTPLLSDASSRENRSECPHKLYIAINILVSDNYDLCVCVFSSTLYLCVLCLLPLSLLFYLIYGLVPEINY